MFTYILNITYVFLKRCVENLKNYVSYYLEQISRYVRIYYRLIIMAFYLSFNVKMKEKRLTRPYTRWIVLKDYTLLLI